MNIGEDLAEMFRVVKEIEFENEVGKASFYFGLALIVMIVAISINIQIGIPTKYGSSFRLEYLVLLIAFFFGDMMIAYWFVED